MWCKKLRRDSFIVITKDVLYVRSIDQNSREHLVA